MADDEKPVKRRRGPTVRKKYRDIDYAVVRALAAQGWAQQDIGKMLGLNKRQISDRVKWDVALQEALDGGRIDLSEEQYTLASILALAQCSHDEIAQALRMSRQGLERRMESDSSLKSAIDGGRLDGVSRARRVMYQSMMDRKQTICMDCQRIVEGAYKKSCPYCDEEDPDMAGKHTNVKHKHIPGNTAYMIFWMKNFGGMADRMIHEGGDSSRPLVFATLADFARHQADKNGPAAQGKNGGDA